MLVPFVRLTFFVEQNFLRSERQNDRLFKNAFRARNSDEVLRICEQKSQLFRNFPFIDHILPILDNP